MAEYHKLKRLKIKEIANIDKSNIGLYDGVMGIAMALLVIGKVRLNPNITKQAISLLDIVSNEISDLRDLEFKNGISGIGWCVEWLVQNEYLDNTNTNEVLEDVDDLLYRSIVFERSSRISIENGLAGKVLYYYRRYLNLNPNENIYRRIPNEACLRWLMEGIQELVLVSKCFSHIIDTGLKVLEMANLLKVLTRISSTYSKAERTIFFLMREIDALLASGSNKFMSLNTGNFSQEFIRYYYSNAVYMDSAHFLNHLPSLERANRYLDELNKFSVQSFDDIRTDDLFMFLDALLLINKNYPESTSLRDINKVCGILKGRSLPICLYHGWGQLMLSELYLEQAAIPNPLFEFH